MRRKIYTLCDVEKPILKLDNRWLDQNQTTSVHKINKVCGGLLDASWRKCTLRGGIYSVGISGSLRLLLSWFKPFF